MAHFRDMKSASEIEQRAAAVVVGQRLKAARESKGLSIGELAQIAGVSHESIRGYERGDRWPQLDSLLKIAATLRISIESLLPPDYTETFRGLGLVVLEGKVEALRRGLLSNAPSSSASNSGEKASYLKRENSIDRIAA